MSKIKIDVAQKQYGIIRHSNHPLDYSFKMSDIQVFLGSICESAEKNKYVGSIQIIKLNKSGAFGYGDIYTITIKGKCKKQTLKLFIIALFYANEGIKERFSLLKIY